MDPVVIKAAIIVCLLGIVGSLLAGLFHLVSDKGESKRMVRALTVRVVLSVALFVLLLVAWWQGWLFPRSLGQ
ncbi:MAG: twin transmembrane helix small protein [Candidatus Obscuribacterales bacterium]|nr:twin transmembrane helix small protein [Steroidobacteraceae bacterium]